MDTQEQLPKKSVVPALACPGERSGVRGQEESHFSSGRVDVESFPARDTVPLRIVEIDLATFKLLQPPIGRASFWPSEPQASIGHPDPIGERDKRPKGEKFDS